MSARFKVNARLDGPITIALVTIDRERGIFSVRPHRARRTYDLPLSIVAEIVYAKVVKAEVAQERAARRGRRGR